MTKKELKEKLDSGAEIILHKAYETKYDKTTKRFIASKEVRDSDEEIVDLAGGDFSRYMKNPVWLFGHRAFGEIEDVIGRCEDLRIEYDANQVKMLTYTGVYAPHEDAQILKQMHEMDMLLATSIGFRVMEYDFDNNIITKWELLEISNVILPANEEAIAYASEKGLLTSTQKQKLVQEKMYPIYKKKLKKARDLFLSDELFKLLGIEKTGKELADMRNCYENIVKKLTIPSENHKEKETTVANQPQYKTLSLDELKQLAKFTNNN